MKVYYDFVQLRCIQDGRGEKAVFGNETLAHHLQRNRDKQGNGPPHKDKTAIDIGNLFKGGQLVGNGYEQVFKEQDIKYLV